MTDDRDNRPEIKCPKHSTGGGPCYCGKVPVTMPEVSADHVDVLNDNGTTTRVVLLADEPAEIDDLERTVKFVNSQNTSLMKERDELAARVIELEEWLDRFSYLKPTRDLLNRKTATSLKLHDADVLDNALNGWSATWKTDFNGGRELSDGERGVLMGMHRHVVHHIDGKRDKLRQEACDA